MVNRFTLLQARRVVVADQQVLFRQGFVRALTDAGYRVVGEASDGEQLEQLMIDHNPTILTIDRYLPGLEVLSYCQSLNALQPDLQILLIVGYEHEARGLQIQAFLAGAAGCLSKDLQPAAYLAALQQLVEGRLLFSADVLRRAARPRQATGATVQLASLTEREREIVQLVAEGLGNREIAERLNISYHTAMKHVSNVIAKLRVRNRMEAGLVWLREGPK